METKSLNVVYKFVDGSHFFTSTDVLGRGLCVASNDLREAYDEIPNQLALLLKLNHGMEDAACVHEKTYEEFCSELKSYVPGTLATGVRFR